MFLIFQTMSAWTIGTMAYFVIKTFCRIITKYFGGLTNMPGWSCNLLITAYILLISDLLIFFIFRFLRGPFKIYALENNTNWPLLSFPVLMVYLMFFYLSSSTTDCTLLLLLLLTTCARHGPSRELIVHNLNLVTI